MEEQVLTRKRIKTSFRTIYFVQSTHFARILHYTVNLLTLRKTAQNIRKNTEKSKSNNNNNKKTNKEKKLQPF